MHILSRVCRDQHCDILIIGELCNSFEGRASANEMLGCPIRKESQWPDPKAGNVPAMAATATPPHPCWIIDGRWHYGDVIMGTMTSQITSLTIVYPTVYSGADQRKHQSSASLAFVRVIHRGPVNSPYKWPVTRKMFPFNDVIMRWTRVGDQSYRNTVD